MIVAAAPAPPVPAPPAKPPLPILSSSLRRGSSSWWFSNGNAHGRDSTTSSRATRRRWWSDPDGSEEDYGSSSLEDEEYDYDYDYDDEAAFPGFGGAGELFDEPWFSKVFKMYGFLLPVMLVSMFAATGTKAFLMAMVFPLGQSAISFLLDAVWGRSRKGNRDDRRWRRPVQEEDYPEDTTDFATGGRGNRYSGGTSSYYEGRRGRRSYQSRVSNDFVDAASTAVGADDNTSSSSSGDGWGGSKSSGGYGGWDEILDNNTAAAQEAKRSSNSFSAGNNGYGTKSRPPTTGEEDADYTAAAGGGGRVEQGVGAPPERMRMRRRRMPRTMGLGSTRYKQAPLLMRLLVAVFPFMGSWFRL
ncbi:hypothetical protein BDA96_03G275000 [Sorghum bicolor]|uniref:Uncharacterized protein n=2 Tax=Sorghum bicolor TaxID=4558 RepID=A0A921RFU2_SORBI|nr:uncharacterized protein LOC8068009 isoform X1 [Sorghum bicolor]EES01246.1 hypothetical protein SORBI_3003G254600 [Sorghum bicolor]KAG0538880.1 hypothetical protein BDA96_03G275000 [Sorghum bicolor]|eukprot:XP_002456126.1 uncharacterized protein LOC8068009 isoform X1 [Sorghum bicolor]